MAKGQMAKNVSCRAPSNRSRHIKFSILRLLTLPLRQSRDCAQLSQDRRAGSDLRRHDPKRNGKSKCQLMRAGLLTQTDPHHLASAGRPKPCFMLTVSHT